ncbi:MAG TPA: glycosyltransferase family 2 protein [Mycobacteriales bacterium]|nr:glycosyltransferase family 2 protein [Mycobacteriales bacterium]
MVAGATPRVDVCVLTWNSRDVSLAALERTLASEQGVPFRVLVRDNASGDGTADAIAARFPDVDLDRGTANLGFAGGMSALVSRGSAPFVLLLNGDAWLEPHALDALLAVAEAQPDAALVVPRVERPDGTLEHTTWPYPSGALSFLYATGAHRLVPRSLKARWLLEPAWRHDAVRRVGWAVGAAWLMPRVALAEVGGLDASLFMYGEDLDWCWRARARGRSIWFTPAAVVRHVGNASGAAGYGERVAEMKARAAEVVVHRHRGAVRAGAYRAAELLLLGRLLVTYRMTRDQARAGYVRAALRGHLHPRTAVPAPASVVESAEVG